MKKSGWMKLKRIASFFLILAMIVGLLPQTLVLAEGTASNGSHSNVFISNAELLTRYGTTKEIIPGFQYDQNQTEYEITIQKESKFRLNITTKNEENLYYACRFNGQQLSGANRSDKKVKNAECSIFSSIFRLNYGSENLISIFIGKKENPSDKLENIENKDVINLRVNVVPSFQSLAVSTAGETATELKMAPEFVKDHYDKEYTLVANGTDTIKLTAKFDQKASLFIGDSADGLSACVGQEIKLADYMVDGSEYAVIPLKLCAEGKDSPICNEYKLIVSKSELVPQITEQPKDIECGNGDKVTLSVGANSGDHSTEYQWYIRTNGSFDKVDMIPGATTSTYTPDTKYTGETSYGCYVSRVINGTRFTTASDIANVTVNLKQVTPPEILQQPGTFICTDDGYKYEYKTEYEFGQKFNRIFITTNVTESTVDLKYDFYYNTQASTENAMPLGMKRVAGGQQGWSSKYKLRYDTIAYEPASPILLNECYVYCVVTATAKDNPEMTASTTSDFVHFTFKAPQLDFEGKGTAESPYLIKTVEDFIKIRNLVNGGQWCSGINFRMENDITLPVNWEPIGKKGVEGRSMSQAFGGILDGGNYTLHIAENGKPLFELVSDAKIKNLKIHGPKIMGSGLINNYFVDYGPDGDYNTGCPEAVTIENVTMLKGSSTLKSGFMDGSGSGANLITIRNCKVEDGVTIGFNKDLSGIGSFVGGMFNGVMDNCISYATVYGQSAVGGLAGGKGQAMGYCKITNSAFLGTIEATGNYIGGLIGQGYISDSAPNTMVISVENSYVAADITGEDFIGGIIGSEGGYLKIDGVDTLYGVVDAYNPNDICNNHFYGKITAKEGAERVGGIVGYYHGVNRINNIQNNFFYDASGTASQAIGKIGGHVLASSVPERGFANDAAYETWLAATGCAKTTDEFKGAAEDENQTVLALLNAKSQFKNWVQGNEYPVLSDEPVCYRIEISGDYKTEYFVGDKLDLQGMQIKAFYSDGTEKNVNLTDIQTEGFDSSKRGNQNVTIKYAGASAEIQVKVLLNNSSTITVYFTLLGDTVHGEPTDETGTHTLTNNNLDEWLARAPYTIDLNDTVLDLIDKALQGTNITYENPKGNYITSVTNNGVTLAEYTNGNNSGWMYTLNGVHSDLGVADQYLNNKDEVIFHYTDDYTQEKDEGGSTEPDTGMSVTNQAIQDAYKATGDRQAAKTPKTGPIGGEWLALGLARAEHEMTPTFKQAYLAAVTTFINENYQDGKLNTTKSTENSRVILALTALGKDPATFVEGKNLLTGLADFNWVKQQGINGPIWALIALDSQNYEIPDSTYANKTTRELLVKEIIDSQVSGGGWSTGADKAEADMTAMAIQALAPYTKTNAAAKTAVNTAIAKLIKMQNAATGAFEDYKGTVNAESTAQVVVALTTMGIDPKSDPRFITTSKFSAMDGLMLFYNDDGQFKHIVNGRGNDMATEQSYYALAAYFRFLKNQTPLYDMTDLLDTYDITVQPGKNGTVTVTPQTAQESQIVTVQVTPDTGYELEKLKIDGIEKTVDQNGKVTFVMPAHGVTVTASFKQSDRAVEQVADAMDELHLSSISASKENYEALQKVENAYKALTAEQKQQLKQEYPDAFDNYEKQRTRFEDAREAKLERYTGKLEDALNKYDQKEYSDENWEKLQDLYADAQDQLLDAPHADAMAQIVEDFKKAAKEVPSGADLNVTFRLIGDSKHENADEHTAYVTWIETTDYQLEAGSTVYDLFVEAMDDADLNYKGADSNYVSSIQAPDVLGGYWLSEFDNGKNSGWMYTVNGKHPDYGLKDWELEDEDVVIWHYVDDYAKEENRGTWLEAKDISPEEYVERNLDEILKIGKHGDVDPDEITMKDLGKDITFKFEPDKGYEVKSVTIDGEKKGKIKEYKYKDLSIYSRIEVEFCEEGAMDFDDVRPSDWFYDDVQYAVSAGLFNGTGDTTFSPNHPMTRAMLVTVLYRLEGEPEVEDYADFIDVGHHEWYTDAVAWASDNDIVNGVGNDQFAPNNNITREQMAAILYRYADYKDYDISDSNSLTGYSDYSQISVYALKPLKWANAEGLINGRTETTLAPTGTATRAEVAAILHRFVENVVE